ncbi:response regulator [Aurantimonas sp. Leaf443]|uniref:response regulator n=1 Tax=Aurantimonas sp. Leaf443 TaxID=1736378 RepID=UPI0006F5DF02|nr:response regulator [Aurantimonas sp. Leaf443]KQT85840.1 MFS transporter [Aurantimonas sp. Leaf443]
MAEILLAEDEMAVRLLVSRALRLEGHVVTEAEDGDAALEILVERKGAFDLVLSDIRMPGLTGIEIAYEIAAVWPDLPILLMTGYAEQKEAAADLAAVIEGVLEKPFPIATVRREVGRVLAARRPRAQAEPDETDLRLYG